MENATTFGAQAGAYASARPTYPDELFEWIASQAPTKRLVWDVGAGSGQATVALVDHFSIVRATDIDQAQVEQAPRHMRIHFAQGAAHTSGLAANCVDAVTVATALHWFDLNKFWQEVRRVARPDALFCAWTYHRAITDADIQTLLLDPIQEVISDYWSDGNRLSWRGYSKDEVQMPFETLACPEFVCNLKWTPAQIAALIRSWSAHKKARMDGHADQLASIEHEALSKLEDTPRSLVLPLHVLAARIN